ncbi:ATP-grasp fold amidoligase family protein [Gracilibacillus suaedae]|uniref:ATP-grasp fold amidoligase family protein n=1 Tax=Gracilibacillus suaedae TaxID=2820273 RepID=UPI001ABE408B|nr:ATP-grasp fold amidoligase family protein [Gracilibacillus suaedae]
MKKHVFLIVRYSMLTENGSGWRIGEQAFEEYKQEVFEPQRLEIRERLFKNITLPSLSNQTLLNPDEFTLLVITSDQLPEKNLKSLQQMLEPYSWARIIPTNHNDSMKNLIDQVITKELNEFNEPVCYCTARLDDDDALANNYNEKLYQYLSHEYSGFCISFGNGYTGIYNVQLDAFQSFHTNYSPKIALGLSYINTYDPKNQSFENPFISIFSNGSHTKVDQQSPTIIDSKDQLYLRTIHAVSDTNSKEQVKRVKAKPVVEPKIIYNNFSIQTEFKEEQLVDEQFLNKLKEEKEELMLKYNNEYNDLLDQLNKVKEYNNKLEIDLELLKNNISFEEDKIRNSTNDRDKALKQLIQIENSKVWRYTNGLRHALDIVKGKSNNQKNYTAKMTVNDKVEETNTKKVKKTEHPKKASKQDNNSEPKKITIEKNMVYRIKKAKENGQVIEYLEDLANKRKEVDQLYKRAFKYAAMIYRHDTTETRSEVYKKALEVLKIEELPHSIVKDSDPLPLKQAASFSASLTMRSRKSQLMERTLPEWQLNDKTDAYKFIDSINVTRPWRTEDSYELEMVPFYENSVIKPTQGAASRGVYFVYNKERIWDVKREKFLSTWDDLKESMRLDLKDKWVAKDNWFVEELLSEDSQMKQPARDLKFYCFYGKVGLILEIVRKPELKYCWLLPDGTRINTGKYEDKLFEGEGATNEQLHLVSSISSKIPAPFMRIDFLKAEKGLVFCEFTPRPGNYTEFNESVDKLLGDMFLEAEERLSNDLLVGKDFEEFHQYLKNINQYEKKNMNE